MADGTPFRRERNLSRRNFARKSSSSSSSSSRYLSVNSSSSLESAFFNNSSTLSDSTETVKSFRFLPNESVDIDASSDLPDVDSTTQDSCGVADATDATAASVRELRLHFESLLPNDRILFKTGKYLSASQPCLENSQRNDEKVQVIPESVKSVTTSSVVESESNDFSDFDDDENDDSCTTNQPNPTDNSLLQNIPEIFVDEFRSVDHVRLSKVEGDSEANGNNLIDDNDDGERILASRQDFQRNYRSTLRPKTEIIATANRPVIGKYHSYHHKGKYDNSNIIVTDEAREYDADEEIIYRDKCDQFIHPILEELIKTEETYVENLLNGIRNYGNIFHNHRKDVPMGLRGKKYVLLGNIEQIAEFHRDEFLPMLQRNRGDLKRLFDEFSVFIDENCFYGYVIFTMNKKNSLKLCEVHKQYLKLIQNEVNDKLGINSFLVQPIQRMARYPLLLQQFITTLFKNRDYVYKPIIESCCRLEKKLRNLLTTTNESEIINDIVECNEFNVFYQGKFRKVSEFYIFDHTLKRGYRSKVFIFDKCMVYTEIRDKMLIFRGCYPCEKIGILAKTKCFTLFYHKRKIQECDFMADAALVEIWLDLIKDMISSFVKEERLKLREKYSRDSEQVHLRPQSLSLFRNSNRFSSDSGIGNMWSLPKPEPENRADGENVNRTTWYAAS